MNEGFRNLDASPPWRRLGFDGKALLEAVVGTVVGLIALFSSYDHVTDRPGLQARKQGVRKLQGEPTTLKSSMPLPVRRIFMPP